MSNKRLKVSELEFDAIKANLKDFLQGQSTFSDYDFEGSNLSVILDILAYNTHYNALYTNFALNEVFLDSASKRNSVVSIAKTLGYTPRSAKSATAVITFTVSDTTTTPGFLTLPEYTIFFSIKDGVRYNFYTVDDISAAYNSTTQSYTFSQIPIKEGTVLGNTFPAHSQSSRYIIPNANLDTDTLKVFVKNSSTDNTTRVFTPADDIALVNEFSTVYFLKEIDDGLYEIEFGDGVLGLPLDAGNVVQISYIVNNGSDANSIKIFSYGGSAILGSGNIAITVVAPSSGGRDPETIEEIRFNAPNVYAAQNRAVTVEDYKALIRNKVPFVDDIIVWGGEDNSPPVYGKVFASATNNEGRTLTDQQKIDLNNAISNYKIATVSFDVVDAEFLDVGLTVSVYYDQTLTNKQPATLISDIANAYAIYNSEQLSKFNSILRNSDIMNVAEDSDQSIVNVIPKIVFKYNLNVNFNLKTNYTIELRNPILQRTGSVSSSGFYCTDVPTPCYIDDTDTGKLILFTLENNIRRNLREVGIINYSTGTFTLNTLTVTSLIGNTLTFTVVPASPDVVSFNNKIVRLNLSNLTVNLIADKNLNGRLKNTYNFTTV